MGSTLEVACFHSVEQTYFCYSQSQSRASVHGCVHGRPQGHLADPSQGWRLRLVGWVHATLCFPSPLYSWLDSRKASKFPSFCGVVERMVIAQRPADLLGAAWIDAEKS